VPPLEGNGLLGPVVIAIGAAALLVGGLAFFVNPKLGIAALGLPAAPVFVLYPAHALMAFVAAMQFDSVASLLPDRTLSLTRILGVAVIGGWAVWALMNRQRVRLSAPGLLIGGYVAFAAFSWFWAENRAAASAQLQTLIQLFLLYVMTANLMSHVPTLARGVDVLIAGTAVLSVLVIWQLRGAAADVERATFTYGDQSFDPNFLAGTLVLPAVAAAALGRSRGAFGWWRIAALLLICGAVVASGSRGAVVGFAAGLGVLVIARRHIGIRVVVAVALVGLVGLLVAPAGMLEHLLGRFGSAGTDRLSGRLDIWKVAVAMIHDRPFSGTGFAGFKDSFYGYMATAGVDPVWALQNVQGMRVAHNVYLGTLAELGIAGLGLLLLAFAAHGVGLLSAWRLHRHYGDPRIAALALALLCSLVSFLVFANSIDFMMRKTPWVMLGMIQGLILATARPAQGALRP
jgi:hypothetical protein